MASISKLMTSAVSVNSEVQASLAAFNFDFSLLKVEAPVEYAGVGSSLTRLRRQEAEDGSSHVAARRLGALFADEIPKTPALYKAYGHRASEISNSPISNPKGTSKHGAFIDHVGADSTNIWAAATSGQEALAIHLLSCLLARIWLADEAVAAWIQLVEERKLKLREALISGSSFHGSHLFASKAEITRGQLAAWDANTRAWLSSADRVKSRQQTQLRLVIDNIALSVSPAKTLYDSIVQTWHKSMTLMEDLLNGKSLSVEHGDLLLGLSAWRIYPDLSVVTDRSTHVQQHDELVPSTALVTVGLLSKKTDDSTGVYWSLPLAHLRHYGKPIIRTRHCGLGTSRIGFDNLLYVALGSIFRSWQTSDQDFDLSILATRLVANNLLHVEPPIVSWLRPLDDACRRYESLEDVERATAYSLMRLGYRYSATFIAPERSHPEPAFGLTEITTLLRVCSTVDSRIKLLRFWARKNLKRTEGVLIRYFLPNDNVIRFTLVEKPKKRGRLEVHNSRLREDHPEHWVHKSAQQGRRLHPHEGLQTPIEDPQEPVTVDGEEEMESLTLESVIEQDYLQDEAGSEDHRSSPTRQGFTGPPTSAHARKRKRLYMPIPNTVPRDYGQRDSNEIESEDATFFFPYPAWTHSDKDEELRPYVYEAGVLDLAAVFSPYTRSSDATQPKNILSISQLNQFLLHKTTKDRSVFLSAALARHIWLTQLHSSYSNYVTSLKALEAAYEIYERLPNSEIDLRVRHSPLYEAHFLSKRRKQGLEHYNYESILQETLSCIAYFETGFVNIKPLDMANAMAICHQDSLYVASRLLQDPSHSNHEPLVIRISGNVGKPGLSVLHPPVDPEMKTFDPDISWQLAEYKPFDCKLEDNFRTTSLHLSFTGASVAYGIATSGGIHRDVHFVETLIQAYDRGEWIADLDILKAMRSIQYGWSPILDKDSRTIKERLCTIDAWDEVLARPPTHAIVRSSGNWMGRLAVVTALAQQGIDFRVIKNEESMPEYCPQTEEKGGHRRQPSAFDKDADKALDSWTEPWLCSGTQDSNDINFEAVLESEANAADVNFGDADKFESSTSSDSEIDDAKNPHPVEVSPESFRQDSLPPGDKDASDIQDSGNNHLIVFVC